MFLLEQRARLRTIGTLGAFGLATGLAACGGSNSAVPNFAPTAGPTVPGPTTAPTGTPAPTSPPPPSPSPAPVQSTQSLPAAGGSLAIPAPPGFIANLTVPAGAPAGTTVASSASLANPPNFPVLSAASRSVQAARSPQAGITPYLFVTFSLSNTVTFPSLSGSIVFPTVNPGLNYYVAVADFSNPNLGWVLQVAGPATINLTTLSFTYNQGFTLLAGRTYGLAIYTTTQPLSPAPSSAPTTGPTSGPTAGPTSNPTSAPTTAPTAMPTAAPTTAPTAMPTAAPTTAPTTMPTAAPTPTPAPISVNPTSVSLPGTGGSNARTFVASESGYAGAFTATGCSGVATAQVGATQSGSATVTVTGVAAGTCTLAVSDTNNQTVNVPVTVTVTTVGGS